MNSVSITAPPGETRPALGGIAWWRLVRMNRNWLLPCMSSMLAAAAVGLPGGWMLSLGATNLVGAILWLSGLLLLVGLMEARQRGTAIAFAVLAVLVLGLAAVGRSTTVEFYLAGIWVLAAGAAMATFVLTRPRAR